MDMALFNYHKVKDVSEIQINLSPFFQNQNLILLFNKEQIILVSLLELLDDWGSWKKYFHLV